jgi:hypothetical protein
MAAVKLAYVWLNLIKKIDILNFWVILCVLLKSVINRSKTGLFSYHGKAFLLLK